METTFDIHPKTPLDENEYARVHARTYAGFAHMLRWFTVHIAFDLVGILCFIEGSPFFGVLFILIGTGLLVWGALTTRAAIAHHISEAKATTEAVAEAAAFVADTDPGHAAAA